MARISIRCDYVYIPANRVGGRQSVRAGDRDHNPKAALMSYECYLQKSIIQFIIIS